MAHSNAEHLMLGGKVQQHQLRTICLPRVELNSAIVARTIARAISVTAV
jgi:hypothetical protein